MGTGVVLDVGDGVTHVVPVFEGFAQPDAVMRSDIAGRDVTDHLALQLRRKGYMFHTPSVREVVRQIKEKECFVAANPEKEEQLAVDMQNSKTHKFTLPDGGIIDLGPERFRAPEILFCPDRVGLECAGVHELLAGSIKRTDLDVRIKLWEEIVLSGGSTMFHKFGDRLLHEVRKLAPREVKIRIASPPDRKLSTWIGGSVIASLSSFKKMCICQLDYQEQGPRILHKNFSK